MKINNISIIGLGLIGGSIAKALKTSDFEGEISAFDKEEVLNAALKENSIDIALKSIEDSLQSDLIFLSTPIDTSLKIFEELAPKLSPNTILTDVCGVKSIFEEMWESIESEGVYIGGHPMTGKEKGGYENSDPLLFENSVYIVTKDLSENDSFKSFRDILEKLGPNILHIPAQQHDVIAASVSHLSQLISVALVNTASLKTDKYNFLDLAAGGFRDMTRISSSDFKIWETVITTNRNQILTALDKFTFEIEKLKKWIENNKTSELYEYFEQARLSRDEIPKNTKGYLAPLYDIYVFVKDEPGVISKISTALFEKDINIKDIELLKIREGTGGTFRLSFETKKDSVEASDIINKLGFSTHGGEIEH